VGGWVGGCNFCAFYILLPFTLSLSHTHTHTQVSHIDGFPLSAFRLLMWSMSDRVKDFFVYIQMLKEPWGVMRTGKHIHTL
jgi:hypothetical protein